MARKHIYDDRWVYSALLPYFILFTRLSYRSFHVKGRKKIPSDGSLIYVCNHTGSLMDPFVQLAAQRGKVVFMARADIFRKPFFAKILHFLRILPVYRIRDGIDAVKGNDKIIAEAVEVLRNRTPLALYPEGTHRTRHSLLRLGKGVFHIALEAERQIAGEWPVYIVPMGIEYGDYFRFRPTVELEIGDPIRVDAFVSDYYANHPSSGEEQNNARLINAFRDHLTDALKPLFTYLPDDDDYEAIWELTKLRTSHRLPMTAHKRKRYNQEEVARLLEMREKQPEAFAELARKALAFREARRKPHVSVYSTFTTNPVIIFLNALLKTLILLLLAPAYLFCGIVGAPTWITGAVLAKLAKDDAWRNTWRFIPNFILTPILTILAAVFTFGKLPWLSALCFTLLTFFAIPIVYDWAEQFRRLRSCWVWLFSPRLREQLKELLPKESE
jgi:1-acyl-sn-glycerol-3-phosphate acyltransferase